MVSAVAHIAIARLAHAIAEMPADPTHWLSTSEQVRLAQMRSPARREQYLAGHWLTRVLLARAYGGPPARWCLLEQKSQPPQVDGHAGAVNVSIAHAADWVAAAVANVAIGIDLEQRPRILDAAIEPLLLNADEATGSLDPDALLQRWVAKEAWIKRNGGSALPAQIRQLQLHAVAREHADVRIDSNAAFHFGLAITPGCQVHLQCDAALIPGTDYAVSVTG